MHDSFGCLRKCCCCIFAHPRIKTLMFCPTMCYIMCLLKLPFPVIKSAHIELSLSKKKKESSLYGVLYYVVQIKNSSKLQIPSITRTFPKYSVGKCISTSTIFTVLQQILYIQAFNSEFSRRFQIAGPRFL